ncbi:pyridoxamine 5'-phosphate oxidase family protein [Streptomyces sp. NPDC014894]|uniref:pyridoxamine 5'-phosphate oxidase family protein n=1 Tax=Streptomyces sp. NPDC014894 TaxID=3364931 RepID=UPI0036FC1122
MTVQREPARTPEQRKQDVLAKLETEEDLWAATASADGEPTLVPLSFVWDRETLLMATRRTNPTARNVTPRGRMVVTLGHSRDVVHIEGSAEMVEGSALEPSSGEAFTVKQRGWNPREHKAYVYLRVTPVVVKAWREVNELADRDLMRDGVWLV